MKQTYPFKNGTANALGGVASVMIPAINWLACSTFTGAAAPVQLVGLRIGFFQDEMTYASGEAHLVPGNRENSSSPARKQTKGIEKHWENFWYKRIIVLWEFAF